MKSRRTFLKTVGAVAAVSIAQKSMSKNPEYDLIIVGAGTAGMPCAIAAAEKGAMILVIEKADKVGGTLHATGGHMSAGGTKHQAAHGIIDNTAHHYKEVMDISKNTAVPYIVKMAVEEAPKTIDWLDSLGFEFAPESPRIVYGHVPYSVARTQYGKDAGESIFKAIKPLWDKYVASGNITVLLNTELKELVVEAVGTGLKPVLPVVKGVIVQTLNNQTTKQFNSKAVVLTTGGYGANPKMFAEKHPTHSRLITTAASTSTGEGIIIAEKAGAKFWNADTHISSLGGIEFEPNSNHADFWQGWAMVFTTSYRPAREIYVNTEGQRFMDEANADPDYRERAVAKQKDKKFWAIFDENGLTGKNEKTTAPMTIIPKWSVEQIKNYAKDGKFLWVADSIEELAKKTGLPVENLKATVSGFNGFVKTGIDAELGRTELKNAVETGPFYALLTYATSLITFGGLAVNDKLQVIDKNQKPIVGLYAAGEIIGAGATTGNAFCGGMLVTPAISFGRILGRTLGAV